MKRYHFIYNIMLMAVLVISLSACDDYLTIYPQDRIIDENFWEDRNDLEGVRYAAYTQLGQQLQKLIIWGDLRSDAYVINPQDNNNQDQRSTYKKILDAQLDSTMSHYNWGGVYTAINYCNQVLENGEDVLARDAQFTRTEWNQMKAEIITLRSLCYFYLIRSFKDIAYFNKVINSDTEVLQFEPTKQLEVLNILISDVEAVQGQARNRYTDNRDTKGLITNTAIYALLADMYLWRSALLEGRANQGAVDLKVSNTAGHADAQKVLDYGQAAIDALFLQNQQIGASSGHATGLTLKDFGCTGVVNNVQLIANEDMKGNYASNQVVSVPSFREIFNYGNSVESMFELQFSQSDYRGNGGIVTHFWGSSTTSHLGANNTAFLMAEGNNTDKFNKDCRSWYSCNNNYSGSGTSSSSTPSYNFKWSLCSFNKSGDNDLPKTTWFGGDEVAYQNWIFYRLTDVLLMMAEAHAVLSTADDDAHIQAARTIIDAVHKRSHIDQDGTTACLTNSSDKSRDRLLKLVMDERLLELAGEGKRWFDLVRYAERIGGGSNPDPRDPGVTDGSEGVNKMIDLFMGQGNSAMISTWKSRMKNRWGLYSPIYFTEMKANGEVSPGVYRFPQNPVWNRDQQW